MLHYRIHHTQPQAHWTLEQWKSVPWTGESRFTVIRPDGRVWLWRLLGEPVLLECIVPTRKCCGDGGVMAWCFSRTTVWDHWWLFVVATVVLLFNDGHILQLRSEIFAVHRWMTYDGHMITEDECDPNFLTFVLRLRENPGKNLNHEIDPTGFWTHARCVRSNHVTPIPQRWSRLLVAHSQAYCTILHNELLATLWRFYGMDHCYFQDDNINCLVSESTMQWYEENNVHRLDRLTLFERSSNDT